MYQQLHGNNAAAIDDPNTGLRFMNDLATYEIFWHFLYLTVFHGAELTADGKYSKAGERVTPALFMKLLDERRETVKALFKTLGTKYEDTDAELVLQILKRQVGRRQRRQAGPAEALDQVRVARAAVAHRAKQLGSRGDPRRDLQQVTRRAGRQRRARRRRPEQGDGPASPPRARLRLRRLRVRGRCRCVIDDAFIAELRRFSGPHDVLTEPLELLTYECDGLPHLHQKPAVVVLPSSADQVQAIVRLCHQHEIPFVARGHGSGLSGGALPIPGGVVIGLSRLNRVLDVDIPNRRVTVEPGVTNLEITRQVAPHGFYYAPDPSSQQVCSIGGNVAENSGGAHCLKYGFTVHHVLGIEAVLPNGDLVRLDSAIADAPGPDLLGVLIGSEGHARRRHQGDRADPAAARERADAAGRLRLDQRGGAGGVGDHRRGHHSGSGGDHGFTVDRSGRSRRASEFSAGRHDPDRRARWPRRRGARAVRRGRGHLPARRRDDGGSRAGRGAPRAHLEGAGKARSRRWGA